MQISILGMGIDGWTLAEKLMIEGHQVMVWDRTREVIEKLRVEKASFIVAQNLQIARSLEEIRGGTNPHVMWMMATPGEETETLLNELERVISKGDIVVDGENAFYEDTQKRFENFEAKGFKYLGIGIAGGILGLKNGYSLMVGGNKSANDYLKPVLDSLAKPGGGHMYFGLGGAGHFVKMVHDGIEYGMIQAVAEGFGLLAKSDYKLNLIDVGNTWQRGGIVASFLVYAAISSLIKDYNLAQFDGFIETKGSGHLAVDTAKKFAIPVHAIEQAVEFHKKSQYDKAIQETFAAKMAAALRHEFSGLAPHKDVVKKETA